MSSKPDLHMQQRNSSPAVTGGSNYLSGMQHSSNQQLKSATVIGAPNMTHKSHLQVMRVLGTPSQLGIRANSDVKSGKQSSSQGTINQSSPPRKFPQSSSTSSPVIQSGLGSDTNKQ
ncbi:unnamed protein product [Lymnaea stagnalis]|uniref:Uncharacterized protein n=1 Tax=Lymnaea stagnalis TaxID=6523 RepID=A0AAV2I301_LYMST